MEAMTTEQVRAHVEAAILKAISLGYRVCADVGWGAEYRQSEAWTPSVLVEYGNKRCCAGGAFLLFGPPEMVQAPLDPQKGAAWVFGQAFGMSSNEVSAFVRGFDSVFVGDPEEGPSDRASLVWCNLGSLMGQFAGRHNDG